MKAGVLFWTMFALAMCSTKIQSQIFPAIEEPSSVTDLEDLEHLEVAKEWIRNFKLTGEQISPDGKTGWPIEYLILKKLARWLVPTSGNKANVSEQCSKDSNYYADEGLAKLHGWAWKMYDASGKMPDGIWSGNVHAMGHFDQCLKIQTDRFNGKYCTVGIAAKKADFIATSEEVHQARSLFTIIRLLTIYGDEVNPDWTTTLSGSSAMLPSIAFCLPDSCDHNDVAAAVADVIGSNSLGPFQILPYVPEENCVTAADSPDFEAGDIVMITILSVIAACLVAGTAYDGWKQWTHNPDNIREQTVEKPCWTVRFLMCFSILSNGSRILQSGGEGQLRCLNGIRLISMLWVFLGHLYMFTSSYPNANTRDFIMGTTTWPAQVITNGTVAVDTFFFISGLLLSYIFLRELDRNKGRFNVIMFYVHRYLRLTPVYALILGFIATLYKYLSDGPNWGVIVAESRACQTAWYKHLLYYNNFETAGDACMVETWYMANDMQMFLITPFVIWPLWKWRRAGLAWLGFVTAGFLVVTLSIVGVNQLPPTLLELRYDLNSVDFFSLYYEKPWCRISPYLVGIFIGWALHKTRGKPPKLQPLTVFAGWAISIALGLTIVYGMYDYELKSRTPHITLMLRVAYAGLHRFTWALILGWVVFACVHGYGGFIDRFLSWEGFVPLSRLTYTTYLTHIHWINMYNSRARVSSYYTPIDMALTYISHVTISMGLAFIISTSIELPFLNLEKLIFAFTDKRRPVTVAKNEKIKEVKVELEVTKTIEMETVPQTENVVCHENQAFDDNEEQQHEEEKRN